MSLFRRLRSRVLRYLNHLLSVYTIDSHISEQSVRLSGYIRAKSSVRWNPLQTLEVHDERVHYILNDYRAHNLRVALTQYQNPTRCAIGQPPYHGTLHEITFDPCAPPGI